MFDSLLNSLVSSQKINITQKWPFKSPFSLKNTLIFLIFSKITSLHIDFSWLWKLLWPCDMVHVQKTKYKMTSSDHTKSCFQVKKDHKWPHKLFIQFQDGFKVKNIAEFNHMLTSTFEIQTRWYDLDRTIGLISINFSLYSIAYTV